MSTTYRVEILVEDGNDLGVEEFKNYIENDDYHRITVISAVEVKEVCTCDTDKIEPHTCPCKEREDYYSEQLCECCNYCKNRYCSYGEPL